MTEIKKIKTSIDIAVTDFRAQLAFGGEVVLTKVELLSLITTVETKDEQLKTCKEAIEALVEDHRNKKTKSDDWIQKVEVEASGYMKQVQSQKEEIEKLQQQLDYEKLSPMQKASRDIDKLEQMREEKVE